MHSSPSVTEVARHFADFVNRVVFGGERFTLLRSGKPVAELGPVPAGARLGRLPELLASLPRLSEEDAAALSAELDSAREGLAQLPLRDPWGS